MSNTQPENASKLAAAAEELIKAANLHAETTSHSMNREMIEIMKQIKVSRNL
jgi:hypothetical protein